MADRYSFILPSSKRLITPEGIFGDNSDVLPPEPHAGGRLGGAGGVVRGREGDPTSLQLDSAILADGLFVGTDTLGAFDAIGKELDTLRQLAKEIVNRLGAGQTRGQVFDRLRDFTSHDIAARPRQYRPRLVSMFARSTAMQLISMPEGQLIAQLERLAGPVRIQLRRPGK